ncbi:MAG: rod shape-determining protein MreD [Bdellovibrionota bacterium]
MISLRHFIILLAFGFLAIFVQGTLLKFISPSMIAPNFMIILVVFLGFSRVSTHGVFLSFLLGLQLDLYSAHLLGPWAGAFVVCFGVIATMSQQIFVESPIAIVMAVVLSTILANLVYIGLIYEFNPGDGISILRLVGETVITAIVSPIIFLVLKKLLPADDKSRGGSLSSGRV